MPRSVGMPRLRRVHARPLSDRATPLLEEAADRSRVSMRTRLERRRAVELAIGVAVGIAVGDLLVLAIGVGPGQLTLVVMLATALAIFLGSGQLLATQAAVSAALVATLQPPTEEGITFARFLDALVGGGVALIVNGLLLPADPVAMVRRAARPVLAELSGTLDDVAQAIVERDEELARRALERARGIDELSGRFAEAVSVSRETTRYA